MTKDKPRFNIGDRVESIRDIGAVSFGDRGTVAEGNTIHQYRIQWDNSSIPDLWMWSHELIRSS